jgi:hypothetical protein
VTCFEINTGQKESGDKSHALWKKTVWKDSPAFSKKQRRQYLSLRIWRKTCPSQDSDAKTAKDP